MRLILRILAAPVMVALTVVTQVVLFLFAYAKVFLGIVSVIAVLFAVVLFVMGQTTNGLIMLVGAFLISPLGLPAIAEWLVVKLYGLNYALRRFVTR